MEIAKLGEFGLIERLTKDIKLKNNSTDMVSATTVPCSIIPTLKCSSLPTC